MGSACADSGDHLRRSDAYLGQDSRPLGTGAVKTIDPDFVFINNSMLETRIDRIAFMNGDPDIRLEHYLDTDHITPGYMNRYIEIFFGEAFANLGS